MPTFKFPSRPRRPTRRIAGAVRTLQRKFRARRRVQQPARFAFSRRRFLANKRLAKRMSMYSETKLIGCNPVNAQAANGQPISQAGHGGSLYAWSGVMQSRPTAWDANIVNLAGIITAQGLASNQHVGTYVYYKKTHLTFQIDMEFSSSARPPIQFRMIVCKSRQGAMPAGITDAPESTLFLTSDGVPTGHLVTGTTAMNTFEVMNQPLNKRDWTIKRDFRFTLSHPMKTDPDGGAVGYTGKYPTRKNISFDLPYYKKTRLSSTGVPQDLDAHYLIYIFATSIGSTLNPSEWNVAMRGTTSYTDN